MDMENRVERERESLFAGLWLPGLGPPRDLFGHHGPHGGGGGGGGGQGGVGGVGGGAGQGPMDRDLLARAKMNANDATNPFKSLNFGLNLGEFIVDFEIFLSSFVFKSKKKKNSIENIISFY